MHRDHAQRRTAACRGAEAVKPFVLPASTSLAMLAGALSTILCWALKQWGGVEVPDLVRDSLIVCFTVAAAHFTTDSPPAPVAREAVSDAADKVDAADAKAKLSKDKP